VARPPSGDNAPPASVRWTGNGTYDKQADILLAERGPEALYAFETFVYLDVQKTGSSFIARFLQDFSKEPLLAAKKHGRIGRREEKLHVISCRDPLDQLLSLYFFGCSKSGHTHRRLTEAGHAALYDGTPTGFERWLRFVLDPAHAEALGEEYGKSGIAPVAGFMTFRFVALSMPRPIAHLAEWRSRRDLHKGYARRNVADHVIRFEHLNGALRDLAAGPLRDRLTDPAAAIAWIDGTDRINASKRADREGDFVISDAAKRLVEDREWFLFDVLGYPRYTAETGFRRFWPF